MQWMMQSAARSLFPCAYSTTEPSSIVGSPPT